MHSRIKRRNPRGGVGSAPARLNLIYLDFRVRISIFIEARKNQKPSIAQLCGSRIPAPMGHVLHVRKLSGGGIVDGGTLPPMEWVILQGSTENHLATIRQGSHAAAEHVPAYGLCSDRIVGGIPDRCLVIGVWRIIPGARDDEDLAIMQQAYMYRIDGH